MLFYQIFKFPEDFILVQDDLTLSKNNGFYIFIVKGFSLAKIVQKF